MKKHRELSDPRSCLSKAGDNEVIFVLRAKDELAPETVRFWASLAKRRGIHSDKLAEAEECAQTMSVQYMRIKEGKKLLP